MGLASDVLILPGLGGSGPEHWQTHWQTQHGYERVQQRDWDAPVLGEWLEMLDRALTGRQGRCLFVAHSLACALVAHYARSSHAARTRVGGALLVAPADVEDARYTPEVVRTFAPMPIEPLPFACRVIASHNDPFVCLARARRFAQHWGADFEDIGDAGHINADSGLGAWPLGHSRLLALLGEGSA